MEITENSIDFAVSTTREIMKMHETKRIKLESETHKKITSFHISQETIITKGDF